MTALAAKMTNVVYVRENKTKGIVHLTLRLLESHEHGKLINGKSSIDEKTEASCVGNGLSCLTLEGDVWSLSNGRLDSGRSNLRLLSRWIFSLILTRLMFKGSVLVVAW